VDVSFSIEDQSLKFFLVSVSKEKTLLRWRLTGDRDSTLVGCFASISWVVPRTGAAFTVDIASSARTATVSHDDLEVICDMAYLNRYVCVCCRLV
jgi:hypothetical protein